MSDSYNSAIRLPESYGAAFDFQSIFLAFLYVFPYTYGTIIQNFNHASFFEKGSSYARATQEKHFCTLTPVLTHAHMLIDFDNARILHARY